MTVLDLGFNLKSSNPIIQVLPFYLYFILSMLGIVIINISYQKEKLVKKSNKIIKEDFYISVLALIYLVELAFKDHNRIWTSFKTYINFHLAGTSTLVLPLLLLCSIIITILIPRRNPIYSNYSVKKYMIYGISFITIGVITYFFKNIYFPRMHSIYWILIMIFIVYVIPSFYFTKSSVIIIYRMINKEWSNKNVFSTLLSFVITLILPLLISLTGAF